jgi:tryptophan-rich sensory protein
VWTELTSILKGGPGIKCAHSAYRADRQRPQRVDHRDVLPLGQGLAFFLLPVLLVVVVNSPGRGNREDGPSMKSARSRRSPALEAFVLIVFLVLCFAAAGLGGYWTSLGLGQWYAGLRKPSWTPPEQVFGPVWTALYAAMAIAAWLAWRQADRPRARLPLFLFGLQLSLNACWPGLFFALRDPGGALAEIVLLWAAILATMVAFARLSRAAVAFMVPYLLWVTFAAALNFAIWRANR